MDGTWPTFGRFEERKIFYDRETALLRFDFMEQWVLFTKYLFYNKQMVLILLKKSWIETLYSFKMDKRNNRWRIDDWLISEDFFFWFGEKMLNRNLQADFLKQNDCWKMWSKTLVTSSNDDTQLPLYLMQSIRCDSWLIQKTWI